MKIIFILWMVFALGPAVMAILCELCWWIGELEQTPTNLPPAKMIRRKR